MQFRTDNRVVRLGAAGTDQGNLQPGNDWSQVPDPAAAFPERERALLSLACRLLPAGILGHAPASS
jgi:hypothetical protein